MMSVLKIQFCICKQAKMGIGMTQIEVFIKKGKFYVKCWNLPLLVVCVIFLQTAL